MDVDLQDLANIAAIATALVVTWAYLHYRWQWRRKRERLEDYLRKTRLTATGQDRGQRTLAQLVAQLGMTEADILQAAFDSKRVSARAATDSETGRADTLFLVYDATATSL